MCNAHTKIATKHEHASPITAFHIKKVCNVIIFIVSWLIISISQKKDRYTVLEQSLTLMQQSRKTDIQYSNKTTNSRA